MTSGIRRHLTSASRHVTSRIHSRIPVRIPSRILLPLAAAILAAACASASGAGATRDAQMIVPPKDSCILAREDAALDPRLDVERVPTPLKMEPPPIRRPVPRTALRRDGSSVIRVEVLVDTLGKPDMTTFAVLESSNVWFTTGAKAAIAKWTFEPALRNGCKIPRYYQFSASSPARAR
jgi:outer membrane biosynthesis protein TonB